MSTEQPIFAPGTVRTYRKWQWCLLWLLPTHHFIEEGRVVVTVKYWWGKTYIWKIRP